MYDKSARKHTVAIIGSGFGGQCAAINLSKRGIEDYVLLERREFSGGTWKQNTYPGAAVDVQSPLYSISHEPYAWSQMFADGDELCEYTDMVAKKHRIDDRTLLGTQVEEIDWKGDHWLIKTNNGEYEAKFVINATGPLSTPVIPDFKGRETFAGEQFHTNDWNHDYDYKGKRVAIVGSGASAAQVIPTIQPDVAELHVFQRTPHWALPRPDRKFTPFQRKLLGNKFVHKAVRTAIYWALETRIIAFKYSPLALKLYGQRRAEKLLKEQVPDPALRAKLTPNYTIGCKRILVTNDLYPALQASNTTLHDKTDPIAEVTPEGIVTAKGEKLDLDLIIWATGYDATDNPIHQKIVGKNGKPITDYWSEYARAYLGTAVPGFPNFFLTIGPNTGIGHTSAIFIIEAQMEYIMRSIEAAQKTAAGTIEVRREAEEKYTDHIHEEMKKTVWYHGGCNSWYKSASGKVIAMYPGFSFVYRMRCKDFKPEDHTIGAIDKVPEPVTASAN